MTTKCPFFSAIVVLAAVCALASFACEPSTAQDEDIDELGTSRQSNATDPIVDRSPVIVEGEEVKLEGGDGSKQSKAIVILGKRGVMATRSSPSNAPTVGGRRSGST